MKFHLVRTQPQSWVQTADEYPVCGALALVAMASLLSFLPGDLPALWLGLAALSVIAIVLAKFGIKLKLSR